jgi:UV DNA damage endonuclease
MRLSSESFPFESHAELEYSVEASFRDLEYHAEVLGLLSLEGQIDRDAVMILHIGYSFRKIRLIVEECVEIRKRPWRGSKRIISD